MYHQTIILLKNFGTLRESAGSALLNHNKYLLNQHCIAYPPSLSAPLLTDVEKVRGAPPWWIPISVRGAILLPLKNLSKMWVHVHALHITTSKCDFVQIALFFGDSRALLCYYQKHLSIIIRENRIQTFRVHMVT